MESSNNQQDFIDNPLQVIHNIFRKRSSTGTTDHTGDWGVPAAFGDLFSKDAYETIPILTRESFEAGALPHNSLVRFRGMIQDMFDPEYYAGVLPCNGGYVTSKFMDQLPTEVVGDVNAAGNECLFERLPVYCVPVPFESQWASGNFQRRCKLQRTPVVISDNEKEKPKRLPDRSQEQKPDTSIKRSNTTGMEIETENEATNANTEIETTTNSKSETPATKPQQVDLDAPWKQYLPDPHEKGLPCLVKLYDSHTDVSALGLGVNQIIEVVGVLSVTREFTEHDPDDQHMVEDAARMPPCSEAPRVHCISLKVCETTNKGSSSLLDNVYSSTKNNITELSIVQARNQAIAEFQRILHGDQLAAEYCMMWALSQVYARPTQAMALGRFSLGLVGTKEELSDIPSALSNILPRLQTMLLSIQSLCQEHYIPKKNNDTNRLRSGRLQFPIGTHVVVNESTLAPGKLDEAGVKNLGALDKLSSQQQVTYDFEYFQKDWTVDAPVLVLSESPKSLVHTDAQVMVTRTNSPNHESINLELVRDYLLAVRSMDPANFEVDDQVVQFIQNDFVTSRQRESGLTDTNLHLWMTLARLRCLSFGESKLSTERYVEVRKLESVRKERLPPPEPIADRHSAPSPSSVHQVPGERQ